MKYEGLDDEEELKMVPIVSQNNHHNNKISDSNSGNNDKNKENVFNENIDKEVEVTLKITINSKVVHAMKKLQP